MRRKKRNPIVCKVLVVSENTQIRAALTAYYHNSAKQRHTSAHDQDVVHKARSANNAIDILGEGFSPKIILVSQTFAAEELRKLNDWLASHSVVTKIIEVPLGAEQSSA